MFQFGLQGIHPLQGLCLPGDLQLLQGLVIAFEQTGDLAQAFGNHLKHRPAGGKMRILRQIGHAHAPAQDDVTGIGLH